jgi:hypothetical protein
MSFEYIAGFFEGEGTITTWRNPRGHTFVRVCIPQRVHPEIVHKIHKFLGYGSVRVDKGGTHRLTIDRKSHIENFLTEVYPHMESTKKRRVAKIAWKILSLQRNTEDNVGIKTSPENLAARAVFAQQIRDIQGRHR